MKPTPLIILAILIHLAIKFFWDYVSVNLYYTGYALVMLLWVVVAGILNTDRYLKIIIGFWLFWALNDFLKEATHSLNILQWLFANPAVKDLNEYIAFVLSAFYVLWQIRKAKHSK